ncbi:hypothetical protein P7C71_g3560, partial [Lecanoromycetidae sp. Uapishka_2]
MAAPQIPNLNSLRNTRGTGRGRGRGGFGSISSNEQEKATSDAIVQQTDQDARTYVRTKAIDKLVETFVDNNPSQRKQIISLGAGNDTRFFRLMSRQLRANGIDYERPNLIYHELDFPENTAQKLKPVYSLSEFCGHCEPPTGFLDSTLERDTFLSKNYCVHPVDLRSLDAALPPPCSFRTIDKELPTLIISECCLCYLTPAAADTVALYFTKHFFPDTTPLGLVLYEPIKPNDPFGKVMVSNLAARGIVLQTLRKYGSLEAQGARMKSYGFETSGGADINTLWRKCVDEKEKERVAELEMVDEVEEWELLAGHYCVAWAWRGNEELWQGWRNMAKQMND